MKRVIVVDGSNVAWENASAAGQPRVSNLVAARRTLEEHGYDPIMIVDATLRHQVDDPDQLEALMDDERVLQAPAGTQADYFALATAKEQGCQIVSNDTFEQWSEEFPEVRKRRVPYMVVRDEFQLHEPSLIDQRD